MFIHAHVEKSIVSFGPLSHNVDFAYCPASTANNATIASTCTPKAETLKRR